VAQLFSGGDGGGRVIAGGGEDDQRISGEQHQRLTEVHCRDAAARSVMLTTQVARRAAGWIDALLFVTTDSADAAETMPLMADVLGFRP
jgi:hypothetical protein